MSDHFDAIPDSRHDITDLYVFQKPGDPTRSILILNVNPAAPTLATAFDPEASYELKIDTNGDAQADLALHVLFASAGAGQETATVYRVGSDAAEATGAVGELIVDRAPVSFGGEARIAAAGGYRFYAGLRSDPFFADAKGFFDNFQWTGRSANADKNVFGIVVDVPNSALGPNPRIGIWARTMAPHDGRPHQMDMAGRPFGCGAFNATEEDRHLFNGSHPAEQRARFLPKYVAVLQTWGYGEAEATELALERLPDILFYDYTSAAGYPNGRRLTDDVMDLLVSLVSQGRVTSDLVGPHADYLDDFPYLGSPHPAGMLISA